VPVRIASEMGRQEFVLVALVPGEHGPVAFPIGKGSGSVTSFSQADGFLAIDALSAGLDAGTAKQVTLIGTAAKAPDIVIMGSHCVALDVVIGRLAEQGFCSAHRRDRQHGRRRGCGARRMRHGAGAPARSGERAATTAI